MPFDKIRSGKPRFRISIAQITGIFILIIVFCVLLGLIIYGKEILEPGTLAMAGILIFFSILLIIYFPVRKMKIDLDETYDKLEIMATTDALTRVFNRKHFNILFEKELSRAKRYERNLGCLMLDIDHFKKINDKYGQRFGDEILQDIAEFIKDNLRDTDILARYSSNSFICLLPETGIGSTMHLSKRLRRLIEGKKYTYKDGNKKINITVSIGISPCKLLGEKTIDIYENITMLEKALDSAKKRGGNRIECFPENIAESLEE